jgi:hypothetical protein
MKKTIILLSMMVLLFSSCVTLEENPTGTPTPAQDTATVQIQASNTNQPTATQTVKPALTQTMTLIPLPSKTIIPSATLTATRAFTPTFTPSKIPTSTPTRTPTKTATPTKTPTPTPYPYILQSGAPVYLANFGYPDAGCNWLGVAGQVFGASDKPLINTVVWVRGTIQNQAIEMVVLTGTSEGNKYGPGGYEAFLSGTAVDTSGIFSIQILDLDGNILSDRIYFDTSSACTENLIILNFSAR